MGGGEGLRGRGWGVCVLVSGVDFILVVDCDRVRCGLSRKSCCGFVFSLCRED